MPLSWPHVVGVDDVETVGPLMLETLAVVDAVHVFAPVTVTE